MVEADEPAVPAAGRDDAPPADAGAVRSLAKPPVRKLARDLGVDLTDLSGSGPSGSITREDVQSASVRRDVIRIGCHDDHLV